MPDAETLTDTVTEEQETQDTQQQPESGGSVLDSLPENPEDLDWSSLSDEQLNAMIAETDELEAKGHTRIHVTKEQSESEEAPGQSEDEPEESDSETPPEEEERQDSQTAAPQDGQEKQTPASPPHEGLPPKRHFNGRNFSREDWELINRAKDEGKSIQELLEASQPSKPSEASAKAEPKQDPQQEPSAEEELPEFVQEAADRRTAALKAYRDAREVYDPEKETEALAELQDATVELNNAKRDWKDQQREYESYTAAVEKSEAQMLQQYPEFDDTSDSYDEAYEDEYHMVAAAWQVRKPEVFESPDFHMEIAKEAKRRVDAMRGASGATGEKPSQPTQGGQPKKAVVPPAPRQTARPVNHPNGSSTATEESRGAALKRELDDPKTSDERISEIINELDEMQRKGVQRI